MSIWETLGIEPTDDLRAVRRAYAAKTRDCHPEEDPEGFHLLHEAYEAALILARGMQEGRRPTPTGAPPATPHPARDPEAPLDLRVLPRGRPSAQSRAWVLGPATQEVLDISAHISKGLEEGRIQETQWRRRRVERMLDALDGLAACRAAPDFYPRWKRCLGSEVFQSVMLEEDLLKGLGRLLAARRLTAAACLALYMAYGFGEEGAWAGQPLLDELYQGLCPRLPRAARRGADPPLAWVGLVRPDSLLRMACWLGGVAVLLLLPRVLTPVLGPAAAIYCAFLGPLVLWWVSDHRYRARLRRWPEHRLLRPEGRTRRLIPAVLAAVEGVLLYTAAGEHLLPAAASPAALVAMGALLLVCAAPAWLLYALCNECILLGEASLVFSVPTAPFRAVAWDQVAAVRRRRLWAGHQLLLLLADGTEVRLLEERYQGHQRLVEAARRRGLLF